MNYEIHTLFAGDLMLGGEYISHAEKNNFELLHPFRLIKPYFSDVDIIFVNLEGPLFKGHNKRPDASLILSNHAKIIEFLKNKSICIVNMANNHIMDYGSEGLEQTIELLEKQGIYFIGAGKNKIQANQEVLIEVKGKKIAFLAYTTKERHVGSIIAGPDKPGCASLSDIQNITKKIKYLKKTTDIVCVSLHWGYEYFSFPSSDQVKIAHALADAGATYIIGHHPHVVQGIEKYKDTLIMYSLGNLFFSPIRSIYGRPHYQKDITKEFMLVKSEIDESLSFKFEIIGGKVKKDYVLTEYKNNDQEIFASKLDKLSKPISSHNYEQFWNTYKIKRERELRKESLIEAFKKLSMIPLKQLIKTITIDDIKRNVNRFINLFIRPNKT